MEIFYRRKKVRGDGWKWVHKPRGEEREIKIKITLKNYVKRSQWNQLFKERSTKISK